MFRLSKILETFRSASRIFDDFPVLGYGGSVPSIEEGVPSLPHFKHPYANHALSVVQATLVAHGRLDLTQATAQGEPPSFYDLQLHRCDQRSLQRKRVMLHWGFTVDCTDAHHGLPGYVYACLHHRQDVVMVACRCDDLGNAHWKLEIANESGDLRLLREIRIQGPEKRLIEHAALEHIRNIAVFFGSLAEA
jgi:hypothetical protein